VSRVHLPSLLKTKNWYQITSSISVLTLIQKLPINSNT
jgi:hypothetical protein